MEKTAKDHIIDTLDDLDDNGLKRFKDKLGETAFQGLKIAKGKLQNAGSVEVATLLISTYTKTHAAENTIAVLKAIKEGHPQVVEQLLGHPQVVEQLLVSISNVKQGWESDTYCTAVSPIPGMDHTAVQRESYFQPCFI
ncbi:UNVERIFIED_CONTAM: hypothetical protein FKN15_015835 [Acipenser sinensis]